MATADEDSKFISGSPQYQTVESDITVYAKFAKTHTLTIHYQDVNGNQLRNDEDKKVAEGETTLLYAPNIESYQPEHPYYEYTMGSEDAEFTITYNEVRCDEKVDFNFQKIFKDSEKGNYLYGEQTPWEPTYKQVTQPEDASITFTGSDQGYYDYCPRVSQDKELVLIDDATTTANFFTINPYESYGYKSISLLAKYHNSGAYSLPISIILTDSFDPNVEPTLKKTYDIYPTSTYEEINFELSEDEAQSVQNKTLYLGILGV